MMIHKLFDQKAYFLLHVSALQRSKENKLQIVIVATSGLFCV